MVKQVQTGFPPCVQATSQTDLENWVTAIHSACASLCAKKHGKEDTVRLLKSQTRSLVQKIDMDSKMKKMAELQLAVVSNPKNRKAIENQVQVLCAGFLPRPMSLTAHADGGAVSVPLDSGTQGLHFCRMG